MTEQTKEAVVHGLQIDVPSEEMRELLQSRLTYHQHKVEAAQQQKSKLLAIDADLAKEADEIGKFSNSSMANTIDQTIDKHKKEVVYFSFMVKHVIPNTAYRLAIDDLIRLGIRADRY